MKIFIIGHKPPDLDTVASAIEYKDFLTQSNRYEKAELVPVLSGKPNKETKFVLNKFNIAIPQDIDSVEIAPNDKFILVDHNEEFQRHEKVKPEQVIEIVDHHKININFTSPIRIDVKPFGSTSTIIFELFEKHNLKPSDESAKLMLAAIISDTQGLKSSLTTGYDSEVAHGLTKRLGLNFDDIIFEIFRAKSDVSDLTAAQVIRNDYKIFDFTKHKVFIGQVETVEPQIVLKRKEDLVKALDELKAQEGATQAYLVITDIMNINSQIIYSNDAEKLIVEQAFTTKGTENVADIGPRMSRKKDIAPEIERVINS